MRDRGRSRQRGETETEEKGGVVSISVFFLISIFFLYDLISLPQLLHLQLKARKDGVATHRDGIIPCFYGLIGAVHIDAPVQRINEPAEKRPVVNVLLQLRVEVREKIGTRPQFDN